MAGQYDTFTCPCCGQRAPVDRVMGEKPFELKQYRQTFGGKKKLTESERLERKRKEVYRGSGPGIINYDQVKLSAKLRHLVAKRVHQVSAILGEG